MKTTPPALTAAAQDAVTVAFDRREARRRSYYGADETCPLVHDSATGYVDAAAVQRIVQTGVECGAVETARAEDERQAA